jgi:hypothetical protein|tara:strand:- start:22 stop:408 length:387 start_codon:yes stop_codon:yes gene_type:complete
MIVQNMHSVRSGKPVANQFIIRINRLTIFQSYTSIIAVTKWNMENILLDEKFHNYSVTTSKYLYQFLGMKRKGIDAMEKVGTLVYTDLNQSMLNPKDLSIYGYEQFIDLFKINMDMIKTINNPVAVSK